MMKIGIGQTSVQKVYAITVIILLLGVLAMQRDKFFGYELFTGKTDVKQDAKYTINDIRILFSDASSYKVQKDSIIVFSKEHQIGWAYNTSPISDSIIGFASSVPLLLAYSNQDSLVGITLLKNYESPDFVQKIKETGFMESWNNLKIQDVLNAKVDVVSGATLTSKAIIKTVKHRTGKILKQSVSLTVQTDFLAIFKSVLGVVLLILALIQFFTPKTLKRFRIIYQILLVVILGFWSGTFLSLFSFNNWTVHGIDLPAKLFVFAVLVLSIVIPLLTSKAFYCSHLCPFGASQDLLGKVRKNKLKLPNNVKQFVATLREKVFATIMLLLFTGVSFDLTNIEPFSAFLFRSASIPVIVLAVTFLLLSIFIPRPWCNYACPTGYLLETIRKPFKK
ncbi:MAG: 4Fe-4S binding protein [Labilibaculum sp.]|nr:4Fe-4S binding protein [Labilibaculum sp.]MBI9057510.1 4Fe-4S binding protein [Labilibaculum sp.]